MSLKTWLLAARPKTLWAAIAPVLMGTAMAAADGGFHIGAAAAALLGAVLIQIGTNFANDYFDFVKGADNHNRLGPTRATQAGLARPESMRNAFITTFGLAVMLGFYLLFRGGWPVLVIGVFSILFGILYTATPYALAYLGIADFFVLVFFGPVAVAGTYYVQTLQFSWLPVIAGLAPGLLSMGILVVNNLRDIPTDATAGKKTLAVRFGKRFAQLEYIGCLLLAIGIVAWLVIVEQATMFAWLTVLSMIPAIKLAGIVWNTGEGRILNEVLAGTGKVLLLFSLLFSVGWLIGA